MFAKALTLAAVAAITNAVAITTSDSWTTKAAKFPRSQTGMSTEEALKLINDAKAQDKAKVYDRVRTGSYWCGETYQLSNGCGRQEGNDICHKMPVLERKATYEALKAAKNGKCPNPAKEREARKAKFVAEHLKRKAE
jgi:hypothetical protein